MAYIAVAIFSCLMGMLVMFLLSCVHHAGLYDENAMMKKELEEYNKIEEV